MNHANTSQTSLDENLYDVSISRAQVTKKSFKSAYSPRRVGSLTSLSTLNETPTANKRPGDYYTSRANNSIASLPGSGPSPIRPKSGDSILSSHSGVSEETANSQFDQPGSRRSSSSSIVLASPMDSPFSNQGNFATSSNLKIDEVREEEEDEHHPVGDDDRVSVDSTEMINSSLSTITLQKNPSRSGSKSNLSYGPEPVTRPKLRSLSTNNLLKRTATSSSTTSLTRTKSRYISAKQTKERQQLRKKLYDDNDDDDEILSNDLNLVFNVPVIRNHSEIFTKKVSRSNSSGSGSDIRLSHKDLISKDKDTFYPTKKPFALPGVTRSASTPNAHMTHDYEDSFNSSFDDQEVTENISQYYSQRSTSMSQLAKKSREQELLFKIPSFIKSQSSLDDLNLLSPEKLHCLDQSRPINLPPKPSIDINKHNKEFKKCLNDYELTNHNHIVNRRRQHESFLEHNKQWEQLCQATSAKDFAKKLYRERNVIRNLNWVSNCPASNKYAVWMAFLNINATEITGTNYASLVQKFGQLSKAILAKKDNEFGATIEDVCAKPLFRSIIEEMQESSSFSLDKFKQDYKTLLYLHSLSSDGLHKHDEIFFIPTLLLIFADHEPLDRIFNLQEQINAKILNKEFLSSLNSILGTWSTSNSRIAKIFGTRYLREFDNLNSITLWNIISQLSDKTPLSLSAPSTPVLFQSFSSPNPNETESPIASEESMGLAHNSATLGLVDRLLQSLVVYINSSSSKNFHLKVVQSLLVTVFKYYHFGWNTYNHLISANISIKLNNSTDALDNLTSFVNKWKDSVNLV
ncbi:Uncharacterized protein ABC855_g1983 [[Candida] zeylanoides]